MTSRRHSRGSLAGLPLLAALGRHAKADTQPSAESPTGKPGMEMLTIFLRHDESKTVDQINQHLKETGWFEHFPPQGVEVVSWYANDGDRSGSDTPLPRGASTRDQSSGRRGGLGWLPDGILPHL